MIKFFTHIAFIVLSIMVYYHYIDDKSITGIFLGVLITTSLSLISIIIEYISENGKNTLKILKSYFISQIRVSCSYLYVIKHNDKYLLVKNNHRDSFQLVGGVFKRNAQSQSFLDRLEIIDDDKLPTSGRNEDDLRLYIKGFQLSKYLRWYNTKKQREISYSREFHEELIEPGFIDHEKFPFPSFTFKTQIITPIIKKPHFNCYEILIYDVLELKLNSDQIEEIDALFTKGDTDKLKWADINTIRNEGYNEGARSTAYTIGDHTKWAIDGKYYKKNKK